MWTKHSRLLGALLSLLMAGLGFTLVRVLRRQEPPPPARQSRPESPREVVEAYWRLSGEGRIDEAARYLDQCNEEGSDLVKLSPPENGWASVIRARHLRITGLEGGAAHPSGATEVIVTATSDTNQAFRLRLSHTLCLRNGAWKISGID